VGAQTLLPQIIFDAGEVDEIAGVTDGIVDAQRRHLFLPARHIGLIDRRAAPLAVVLGKNLHCVTANRSRAI
jgi:hypothetical protein